MNVAKQPTKCQVFNSEIALLRFLQTCSTDYVNVSMLLSLTVLKTHKNFVFYKWLKEGGEGHCKLVYARLIHILLQYSIYKLTLKPTYIIITKKFV